MCGVVELGSSGCGLTLVPMLTIKTGTTHKPVSEIAPAESTTIHLQLPGQLRRDLSQIAMKTDHSMSSLIRTILEFATSNGIQAVFPSGRIRWVP